MPVRILCGDGGGENEMEKWFGSLLVGIEIEGFIDVREEEKRQVDRQTPTETLGCTVSDDWGAAADRLDRFCILSRRNSTSR